MWRTICLGTLSWAGGTLLLSLSLSGFSYFGSLFFWLGIFQSFLSRSRFSQDTSDFWGRDFRERPRQYLFYVCTCCLYDAKV